MIVVDKDIDANWIEVLKEGELFFFSTAISAAILYSAMDKLLVIIDAKSGLNDSVIYLVFVSFSAMCVFFLSAAFSGILIYFKLKSRNQQSAPIVLSDEGYRKLAIFSIFTSIFAVVINMVVNIFL